MYVHIYIYAYKYVYKCSFFSLQDEVNREYMTRLLIDEGRKRVLRQYSFLTPQDMTLTPESFIKIQNLDK